MADLRQITEIAAGIQNNTSPTSGIDATLQEMQQSLSNMEQMMRGWKGGIPSQSNARTEANGDTFRNRYRDRSSDDSIFGSSKGSKGKSKGFMDSFEDQLLEGFLGSNFKKEVRGVFKNFADQLNVDIKDIPGELGKQLGKTAMNAFRQSKTGQQLMGQVDQLKKNFLGNLTNAGNQLIDRAKGGEAGGAAQAIDRAMGPFARAAQAKTGAGAFVQGGVAGLRGLGGLVKGGFSALRQAPGMIRGMFQEPVADVREENMSQAAGSEANVEESNLAEEAAKTVKEQGANAVGEATQGAVGEAVGDTAGDVVNKVAGEALEGPMNALGGTAQKVAGNLLGVGGAGGKAATSLLGIEPAGLAAAGAMIAIEIATEKLKQGLKDIFEGISKIFGALGNAANRDQKQREENLKAAKQRMKDDYETMVKAPFELLEKAANDLYNSWNQNLTTVAATQGYTKSDVQDLMAAYAERIRSEGLSSYVSGANLFDNLAKVLDSGLSGKVAEEFAYQATVLGKAIPTQDFFNYASTYASVAANAIRQGMTQEQAIAKANSTLEEFASGLLYTTRELTGGFTTGLRDAQSLYENASKIALAAQSDNISAISGTLLAVQGYVGAVAPDIASAITDTIYQLATGGNSGSSVALRSLAGVNASNTEFLKAFAANPQKILSTMFENLSSMYSESPDAYMEKAEGYAELFGLSAEAFQRVDFADLAQAIKDMNINNTSLDENMALLLDGQTTTTAEQLKAQQINQYMIEEGLSYLIDNEVAQQIQQHMWQEQIAREIVQSNFSVDLVGDSKEGLTKIIKGVSNILSFLNPFSWLKKAGNVIGTAEEAAEQSADIKQMLLLGKVGGTNEQELAFANLGVTNDPYLKQLTTYNENLGLARSIVDQMGGRSAYNMGSGMKTWDSLTNPLFHLGDSISAVQMSALAQAAGMSSTTTAKTPTSQYSWGGVSKTQGRVASTVLTAGLDTLADAVKSAVSASSGDVTAQTAKNALDKMMEESYIKDQFVKQGKSYEDWVATASKFGIADYKSALESAGYNEEDVKSYFQDQETSAGAEAEHERDLKEEHFWEVGVNFWDERYWADYVDPYFEKVDLIQETLETISQNQLDWAAQFNDDWIETAWNQNWLMNAWAKSWVTGMWGDKGPWATRWSKWIGEWIGKNSWMSSWNTYATTLTAWFGKDGDLKKMYTIISDYMLYRSYYGVSSGKDIESSKLLDKLEQIKTDAKSEDRESIADQLGKVLSETLITDKSTDPALQTNILLGQILVYVGRIMEQTNGVSGGSAFVEQLSAMALGLTQTTP